MSSRVRTLIAEITTALRTKSIAASLAYWDLATTGKAEAAEKAADQEKELRLFLSNPETFAVLKQALNEPTGDPLLDRQVVTLYNSYRENQLDEATINGLVEGANELEQIFSNFRGTINGEPQSDNAIREVLAKSTDNTARKAAWQASKQIGGEVAPKLVDLVKLRNQAATGLGFKNYYEMQLELSEIEPKELWALLDELKELTDAPFAQMKAEVDAEQAKRFGITPAEMQPWHYADPFFQEVPAAGEIDLDPYLAGKSIEDLSVKFFDGVRMDVRDIIARSDLYERGGKNQHAFCTDIDREGDIRVLCNLKPNAWWMSTMLHELGHAAYDKYVEQTLPWLLHQPAHINSTEAIAMYFGRLTRQSDWLNQIAGVPKAEADSLGKALAREESHAMLIFVRWVLVMSGFESRLYEDPDQDLNKLWWSLVQTYQFITPPAELTGYEWATKIHIATAPVYYHNYLIGEVTASHLKAHIAKDTGSNLIVGNRGVGDWLKERFFKPGASLKWNDLVIHATGEPLSPSAFVTEFVSAETK